ncbi:DUF402 domain-containing protein [Dictyobacter arantiisoli]|uniref:DUF402 domain-containing protein n=1 Tax=Dictyobacter arantiisoli TaxID=2014874 RepID=A0A5A5T6S8_9CHLR|nr:DUF402 domain-containing protein [Dictyobacter arantiisoli]GCF06723.1 hypothetical protein KDI_02870 [Dictyobacter arantiisoli]
MLLEVTIRKLLVNGDQWASWRGYHIPVSDQYFVIWTPMGTAMHWKPGTWTSVKHTLVYFWSDAWHTLHAHYNDQGTCIGVYCDVVLPQAYDKQTANVAPELVYIDLYVDVVVEEDFNVYTKDQEVFERAARKFPLVKQSRQQSYAALDLLEQQAKSWTGPFAVIPRQLPRTDFALLDPLTAAEILRSASPA